MRGPGLRLFAVAALDLAHQTPLAGAGPLAAGTELVVFRDVGAIVVPATYAAEPLTLPELDDYRAVIDEAFAACAVVPAPPGTVFRSREALVGWLELHYFTLVEALNFVEGRAVARVTVTARGVDPGTAARAALRLAAAEPGDDDARADPAATPDAVALAADAFRVLRRDAVSFLVLRPDGAAGSDAAHGSFLVDRPRWDAFVQAVAQLAARSPALRFDCSGPWPPYDFVRLQFRG